MWEPLAPLRDCIHGGSTTLPDTVPRCAAAEDLAPCGERGWMALAPGEVVWVTLCAEPRGSTCVAPSRWYGEGEAEARRGEDLVLVEWPLLGLAAAGGAVLVARRGEGAADAWPVNFLFPAGYQGPHGSNDHFCGYFVIVGWRLSLAVRVGVCVLPVDKGREVRTDSGCIPQHSLDAPQHSIIISMI